MSNILALPLIKVEATTQTNEDWIDGFAFFFDDAATLPIDLADVEFEMEVRHLPPDHTVVLHGTTADGGLVTNANTLQLNFPVAVMNTLQPLDYVFDIVMHDDEHQRVLAVGTLTAVLGITR